NEGSAEAAVPRWVLQHLQSGVGDDELGRRYRSEPRDRMQRDPDRSSEWRRRLLRRGLRPDERLQIHRHRKGQLRQDQPEARPPRDRACAEVLLLSRAQLQTTPNFQFPTPKRKNLGVGSWELGVLALGFGVL